MSLKSLERIETSIIVLFVFSLPFYNVSLILNKVTPFLILIWAIISIIKFYLSKSSFHFNIFFFILVGFYFLYGFGLLYSDNLNAGLLKMENKSSFLIIPILALLSASLYQKRKWYLISFVISNFLASIICLFIAIQDFTYGNLYYTNFSYFLHPSYFALYVVFSIHIAWQFISTEKDMGIMLKLSLYAVMLYFAIIVYLISSKIGIISGVLSLSIILFHEFRTTYKFSKRSIFLVVMISVFVYSGITNHRFRIFSENIQKTPTENTHTRFLIWQESLDVIEENIFFGQGTGDAQSALNTRYLSKGYLDAYEHQLNAHNQYLETFVSIGLIGFIMLLLLFILPVYYLKDHFEILSMVFLFLIGFHLLFESMFERFWGIVFFAFFFSLFFISRKSVNEV